MLVELNRYNNIGDKAGVENFVTRVFVNSRIQKSSLFKLCSIQNGFRLNFDAAVAFFKYLNLLDEKAGFLYSTPIANELNILENFDYKICKLCLIQITKDGLLDPNAIHYNQQKSCFVIERYGFSISSALFRNTLIQYKAITEDLGVLLLNPIYEEVFIEYRQNDGLRKTIEQLEIELQKQKEQGEIAERFIMEYEKRRLANSSKAELIKQISNIDVSAGYDILSFENSFSNTYDRYIEVKSYNKNEHFYWSENEIEKAKLIADKYFIYLVDISKISKEGYDPTIIQNPANTILGNDEWILSPTSFLVLRT